MDTEFSAQHVGPNLGMTSLVIGLIGLALFFLPILGIPLGLLGVGFGVVGLGATFLVRGVSPRWCLEGIAVSCVALAANYFIATAPDSNLPSRNVPKQWQPATDKPFVAPPEVPSKS
jgi:hypothetical protein